MLPRGYVDVVVLTSKLPNPYKTLLTSNRTSASSVRHRLSTRTAESMLSKTVTDDNNKHNDIHTVESGQRISVLADYRASIAALFNSLYPGYIADYHARNSFYSPNQDYHKEDLRRPQSPCTETADWPSPTVSEFLRVPSPSTSWIDIDEYSDGDSSTSASQEEELPEIPDLFLGSPLVPVPPWGLFNMHEDSRVVKASFCHRIPERAPSFGNLECGWDRPDPKGNYLRTLGSNGHVKFIPFSPVAKIQYAEPEVSISEGLVALNQDSPLVLRARRARLREYQKMAQQAAELRCNDLSGVEAVQLWCNAADTTLPPPDLPELTRSQLGANLARLRSRILRLRSDMADKQFCQADKPEHLASEHGIITQSTAPLPGLHLGHPSLHLENDILGHIASGTVNHPCRTGLTTNDCRCVDTVVNENFRVNSLAKLPGYDGENVKVEKASVDEMCHPSQIGSIPANDHTDGISSNEEFHDTSLMESPVYERGSVETGDASIDAACHPCHVGLAPKDNYSDDIIHNGGFRTESLPRSPGLPSDIVELGHAVIGRAYRPRVGLTLDDHRRRGVIFDQELHVKTLFKSLVTKHQNTEPQNASSHDELSSSYGVEQHRVGYVFNGESRGVKPHDLVMPPTLRSRKANVANLMKHGDTKPLPSEPEDSITSAILTGTVIAHRLRRRRGMIFDASMEFESRNISSGCSNTLWDIPLCSPDDAARKVYNHELTLAMLEGRVKNKEFGSPMRQAEYPDARYRNSSSVPEPDLRRITEPGYDETPVFCASVGTPLAPPEHSCGIDRYASTSPIVVERHSLQAKRRLSLHLVDENSHGASVLPSAIENPINAVAAQNLDETMPTISYQHPSKFYRSPKAWLRGKAKRIAQIFR